MTETNSEELKALTRKRGGCKTSFTNFSKFLNEIQSKDAISSVEQIQLEERVIRLENTFVEFNQIQTDIEAIAEDVDAQYNSRNDIENTFYLLLAEAKLLSKKANPQSTNLGSVHEIQSVASADSGTQFQGVKLPTIQLPKFDGTYELWLEFRDTFDSLIHTNNKIVDIQKHHYLRASLQGNAAAIIKSIEFSSSGYNLAWEAVCERYNNKKLLIHNHIKALFSIEAIQKESYEKFRTLVDNFSKHLRSLEQLNQPCDQWNALLIFIMTTKLDNNTLREWERHNAKHEELPTLLDLKKFLKARADLLESLELKSQSQAKPRERDNKLSSRGLLTTNYSCTYCEGDHSIYTCEAFLKCTISDRWNFAKSKQLCTNCLREGHSNKRCKIGPCRKCKSWHNSLLHSDRAKGPGNATNATQDSTNRERTSSNVFAANKTISCFAGGYVFLSTAIIKLKDCKGKHHQVRALLDCGSQSSFVTQHVCNLLGIKQEKANLELFGIGNKTSSIKGKCKLEICAIDESLRETITCYILPVITHILHHPNTSIKVPSGITLADPNFAKAGPIDVLIGADLFWHLLCPDQIRLCKNGPILQNTRLGWIICGSSGAPREGRTSCNVSANRELHKLISKFWEIEEVPDTPHLSEEELFCERHFQNTTTRDIDGRFIVTMPLKQPADVLGESRLQAERRYISLEKRMVKNEALRECYTNFMREYQELNHMSLIDDEMNQSHTEYFMPHHGVIKEDSLTTKLRVVFDASAPSSNGLSLNNIQGIGPTIQEDLFSILLRFRKHAYAISADITKMYRQVLIEPAQSPKNSLERKHIKTDEVLQFKHCHLWTSISEFFSHTMHFSASRRYRSCQTRNCQGSPPRFLC